ncbi:MAG: winged helix-turn-helix transcriptional regulator [Candidatus Bathyarchaeia archaeon]
MKKEKLFKLLKALLKNSRRSDRELAKAIGASQPTVTRNRKLLSKYIRSYTIVPEFKEIGYEIAAFTFAKAKTYRKEEVDAKLELMRKWANEHANILFASDGEGLGKDAIIVSVHNNYSKYADFIRDYAVEFADFITDIQSFIVSLKTGTLLKPLDLTYLADDIKESFEESSA